MLVIEDDDDRCFFRVISHSVSIKLTFASVRTIKLVRVSKMSLWSTKLLLQSNITVGYQSSITVEYQSSITVGYQSSTQLGYQSSITVRISILYHS